MDMTLGTAMPDPEFPLDEHLKDGTALWFADWKSNRAYSSPTYYACMKPQNFDSALTMRAPVRFGNRFFFGDSEPIVAGKSDFDDRTVASDQLVPRFWAVVKPGTIPPRVVGIDASLARGTGNWTVDYKLEIIASPARPNPGSKSELTTSPGATTCNIDLDGADLVGVRMDGSGFEIPVDFAGAVSIRAISLTESKKSGWTQDRWIIGDTNGGPLAGVSHCPQTIIDTSFAEGGQALRSKGWSTPEACGTWSTGGSSNLAPCEIRESHLNARLLFAADVRSFVSS